jgi:hypothetical protein
MTTATLRFALVSALVGAGAAAPWLIRHSAQVEWRERDESLRQQARQLSQLAAETERLSNLVAQPQPPRPLSQEQLRELLRLRNEITWLRQQTNLAHQLQEENRQSLAGATGAQNQQTQLSPEALAEQLSSETTEAMKNLLAALQPALRKFAMEHSNRVPGELLEPRDYFPSSEGPKLLLHSFQFVPGAQLMGAPAGALVLREATLHGRPNGKWARVYGFADGSVIEVTDDDVGEDFDAWEKQHLAQSPASGPGGP